MICRKIHNGIRKIRKLIALRPKELSKDNLREIKGDIYAGKPLEDVLSTDFPRALICVIRGHDGIYEECHTDSAFFYANQANRRLHCLRHEPDKYKIVKGTASQFDKDEFRDPFTGLVFDREDKEKIYALLSEKFDRKSIRQRY